MEKLSTQQDKMYDMVSVMVTNNVKTEQKYDGLVLMMERMSLGMDTRATEANAKMDTMADRIANINARLEKVEDTELRGNVGAEEVLWKPMKIAVTMCKKEATDEGERRRKLQKYSKT